MAPPHIAASRIVCAGRRGSPLSQKLTLRELREGRGKSLASCLRMEFRMVSRIVDGPSDFEEGIRALLIDKDGKPAWQPPSPEKVSAGHSTRLGTNSALKDEVSSHILSICA